MFEIKTLKKERESGVELLRIIAILMVIAIHLFSYGNFADKAIYQTGGFVGLSAEFIRFCTRPAVNIFIIITGFFTVHSKFDLKKSYSRAFKTYLVMLFYCIALSVLTLLRGPEHWITDGITYDAKFIIIRMFLPLTTQSWYFLSNYVLLLLLAPFVNIVLQTITKKQYQVLLGVLSFVMSVWVLVAYICPYLSYFCYEDLLEGKNLFSFIYLYIIGGYLGLHTKSNPKPKFRYLVFAFLTVLVNFTINFTIGKYFNYVRITYNFINPFVLLCAVFLFMFFKDLHFKSRIINVLASTTIGVYAISEFKFMREWLWNFFDFSKFDCSNALKNIIAIVVVCFAIFIVCAIIDLIRQFLFSTVEKLFKSK